jgi:RHH-type proline utilization regulon transcriptional repressor/proline dehydrogenase/delta 1-pyrroline-5-carboxylate dehydrogenase
MAGKPHLSATEKQRVDAWGRSLLEAAYRHEPRGPLSDKLLDWAMADAGFKTELFRFVDVFPMLQDDPRAVHEHLRQYLDQPGLTLPTGLSTGLKAGGWFQQTLSHTVANQVRNMANRFIAGDSPQAALSTLRDHWKQGIGFSIDILGEACVSEAEASQYRQQYIEAVQQLAAATEQWPDQPALAHDHLGPIPKANLSIKISALAAKVDPADHAGTIDRLMRSLKPILEAAQQHHVLINFDMEHQALKDLTLTLFMRACEQFDFPAGIALQAYLKSGEADARTLIDWSRSTGRPVTVRLVKGAYWDYEQIHAEQQGWPVPVWPTKRETDACFERMAARLIEATPRRSNEGGTKLAVGSHNVRSIAHSLAKAQAHDLPPSAVELQMLYGMAKGLQRAAVAEGLRVRQYVPTGEMIPGMAYLVRRLLENSSNESWLRAGFTRHLPAEQLLASPHEPAAEATGQSSPAQGDGHASKRTDFSPQAAPERHQLAPAVPGVGDGRAFFNEPHRDFSNAAQREAFEQAIHQAKLPTIANDGTAEDARQALGEAADYFPTWRDWDPVDRARLVAQAADLMRKRRDELAGLVIQEAGKPWPHADGDVCEAIDFCEYYARQSVGLFEPKRLGRFIGEFNEQWHLPRGPAVVISPWNFPLAICAGMTAAALVTGNPTIVKPAEQTPGIAYTMAQIFWQAGVPHHALQYLAGEGETVGAALVRDPRTALIAFTGSKAVGLDIVKAAGTTDPDQQTQVKKVVCEMGGKNAIIVDESADPDAAVLGVMHSAFDYAGQRCSACSRVIVLPRIYDRFVSRLIEATKALGVGDSMHPGTDVSPVIDQAAAEKVRQYIALAKTEGELALAVEPDAPYALGKPVIGPHIVTGIESHHRLAQEEVFGPVLSVMRADSFEQALSIANDTPYRLTGGVFSRTPMHLHQAKQAFRVGNLYLNRGITGSLVGRQPFGGFGMSGVGAKSGSDEYLNQFVVPRSCTENTIRRGFAPGLTS